MKVSFGNLVLQSGVAMRSIAGNSPPDYPVTPMLIVAGTVIVFARILSLSAPFFLSPNDASRWATVRALVDQGTYSIGHRDESPDTGTYIDKGIIAEPEWETIDKVLNPSTKKFYSSKPPLLPSLVAAEYWVIKRVFNVKITEQCICVIPLILVTVNGLPFAVYLVLIASMLQWLGATQWGKLYTLVAAIFGTYIHTFAISLNNHSVAAYSTLFALYGLFRIQFPNGFHGPSESAPRISRGRAGWKWFIFTGFCAGFVAANELPALSFVFILGLFILWLHPWRCLCLYFPAAALPLVAFLACNSAAIGQLRPAYFEGGSVWYRYEGSYWDKIHEKADPENIDLSGVRETKLEYAFHTVLGHHGIFSLSPIYLLAVIGMIFGVLRRHFHIPFSDRSEECWSEERMAAWSFMLMIHLMSVFLTIVLLFFYIMRTTNYGGTTTGPRWFIWMSPVWLLNLLPVADVLASRRWGRILAYFLLAASIFSANYSLSNPWVHPWLYDFFQFHGFASSL